MKLSLFFSGLVVTLTTLNINIYPAFSQSGYEVNFPDEVTFSCREMFDPVMKAKLPMTVAWVPERKGYVRFITWKSQLFGQQWNPSSRCRVVSSKFDQSYQMGSLQYLTAGTTNGYPIVCATTLGGSCNSQNQLFTMEYTRNPWEVLGSLVSIMTGSTSGTIMQSAETSAYLSVNNYIKNAPIIGVNDLR